MARLDVLAARAVFTARAFERAVHDPGPWQMRWGPFTVPAQRLAADEGIGFAASFPEHCFLSEPEPMLTLLCRGDVVLAREIEFPGDQGFSIAWVLAAEADVPAA